MASHVLSRTLRKLVSSGQLKQAIVIRTDLEMGRGKIASQAAHASLLAYDEARKRNAAQATAWATGGAMKIVLKVGSERELGKLFVASQQAGLPAALVHDAGHTQIAPGSATAVGIGPADEKDIDAITGALKLL